MGFAETHLQALISCDYRVRVAVVELLWRLLMLPESYLVCKACFHGGRFPLSAFREEIQDVREHFDFYPIKYVKLTGLGLRLPNAS